MNQEKKLARWMIAGIFGAQILVYLVGEFINSQTSFNVAFSLALWPYYIPYGGYIFSAIALLSPTEGGAFGIFFLFAPVAIEIITLYFIYRLVCLPLSRFLIKRRGQNPLTQI